MYAVALAGGAGTRFWPRSREAFPKQLVSLAGGPTLLQATILRLEALLPRGRILVATNRDYTAEVLRQWPQATPESILQEPCRRDTGPAVALAATAIASRTGDPQTLLVFAPSDHWIEGDAAFRRTIMTALTAAAEPGSPLVTIGVFPGRPETGFGYIETGRTIAHHFGWPVLAARRFVEKPDRKRAAKFARGGKHLWNSGMLVCSAGAVLDALGRHEPGIGRLLGLLAAAIGDGDHARLAEVYARMPRISIDRAVLERASNVEVVPAQFRWDDVGSWSALARVLPAGRDGNLALGRAVSVDAAGCIIDAGNKPVALLGVKDLVIVDAGDVLMVADRKRDQDVKLLRERIKQAGFHHLL